YTRSLPKCAAALYMPLSCGGLVYLVAALPDWLSLELGQNLCVRGTIMSDKNRRGVNRFHEREVARALRATRAAGENIDRIEIDPTTGKIAVVVLKPGSEAAADKNEWDEDQGPSQPP